MKLWKKALINELNVSVLLSVDNKEIKKMMRKLFCIKDALYWYNFRYFLLEGKFDYQMIRKLSEKLANDGDSRGLLRL